ncbi:MAG: BrnA antitoxin family protein [Zoogloeaceae bacterium]|jgi:uncharacterized protein (DUF4415 family)|nr:BrnA antitoxin family protein [Zoogloeaceae bacterium]
MKPNATSKPFFDAKTIAAALAAAPEHVEDPDCPYDPNDPAAVEAFFKNAIVSHSRAELEAKLAARKRRGPGKAPRKTPATIRFDPDVLAGLRATGKGWQTRANNALRDWLKTHSA